MDSKVCAITPTYIGDIDQFSLLRRSINLFSKDIHHIVVVQTEDFSKFYDRFSKDGNITLVRSKEVLPAKVERFRLKSTPQLFDNYHLLSEKYRHLRWKLARERIQGWHAQQITKLFTLANSDYDVALFIDSDMFLCQPLMPSFYRADHLVKIYRQNARNAEQMDFDIATHEILGNPIHEVTQLYDYIFSPCVFKRSTARTLLSSLSERFGSAWIDRFLEERRPSEYNLLGYAAMVLENGDGYSLTECAPKDIHHSIRYQVDQNLLSTEIERALTHPKGFFLIQSLLKVPFSEVERAFEEVIKYNRSI